MSVCIETRSLSVENTEGLKILDDVSIDISCGDFVIVSGPSGGGKSTLLKIFIGIVEAFRNLKVSGYVRVLDVDVLKEGFRKLLGKVGIVFQNPINE
ncbi:MAG: ATP-binding cassette domain-containing protein, partial [Ignisphaera sp.]